MHLAKALEDTDLAAGDFVRWAKQVIDALDQISKYTGSDEPSLTKMGGADWAKTKARAKKAVNEVAKELIRLYAVRQQTKGHAFGPDTPWQRELEDAFPYVETPDQLVTIDEVKAAAEKGGYNSFMEKEIHEQPAAVEHTLMGRLDENGNLRITFGRMTTEEEVQFAAELIKSKIGKLRELSPLWEMFKDGIDLNSIEWAAH